MQLLQAFKYQIKKPSQHSRGEMRGFVGSSRFVFNKALSLQIKRQSLGQKHLSYYALCKELTAWRSEALWLKEVPIHPLQQSLMDLEKAYTNFFKKQASFPRFKKKSSSESLRYPDAHQIKLDQVNSRIYLPKLGWLRYRKSREIQGELRNVTLSCQGENWFISIQTKSEVEKPVHPSNSIVGIDVGISQLATLSDGMVYRPTNSYLRHEKRLAFLQRQVSRKIKFSKNWKKAQAKVNKFHHKIAQVRADYLHKTSTEISKNHGVLVVEDLKIANMSKSAKGTVTKPGHRVKSKSGLNKSILDQGWGEFRRQLEYKQARRGGRVLAVPASHTSQKCSQCQHVSIENRKSQSKFVCVQCGLVMHADLNAACNLKAAGLAVLACGELASGLSLKQEPTDISKTTCFGNGRNPLVSNYGEEVNYLHAPHFTPFTLP